jgi:hypothetical protein
MKIIKTLVTKIKLIQSLAGCSGAGIRRDLFSASFAAALALSNLHQVTLTFGGGGRARSRGRASERITPTTRASQLEKRRDGWRSRALLSLSRSRCPSAQANTKVLRSALIKKKQHRDLEEKKKKVESRWYRGT